MKLEAARPNEVRELIELNGAELDAVTGGVSSLLTTWKCVHTCTRRLATASVRPLSKLDGVRLHVRNSALENHGRLQIGPLHLGANAPHHAVADGRLAL